MFIAVKHCWYYSLLRPRKNKPNIKIAYYDINGLPNSEYFVGMKDEIKILTTVKKPLCLLTLKFQDTDIAYGFSYGDEILVQITGKIKAVAITYLLNSGANRFCWLLLTIEKRRIECLAEKLQTC